MDTTRRRFLAGSGAAWAASALAACSPAPGPDPLRCDPAPPGVPGPLDPPGADGLIDEAAWQARCADYLRVATERLDPANPVSVSLHLLRARRDPAFVWDPAAVTVASLGPVWARLDAWKDTGDFVLMELHWMRALGRDVLDPEVLAAVDRRLLGFRYRYDDPLPADRLDHKWFWSENHRIIFAVVEFLSGHALPDETFEVTGLTGAEHAARARPRILDWVRERARYGFSEWHSNVYLPLNVAPLLTVLELGPEDDLEVQRAAVCGLDLCLLDLAAHLHRGVFGATRGRTYEKDKLTARDEGTFTMARLLFDDTRLADGTDPGFRSVANRACLGLVGTDRYRLPELLRRMATSREVGTVLERHGLPLDPSAPLTPWPAPIDGHGFGVDELEFWWSHGAVTAWQVVPATLEVADRYRLWDTDLFRPLQSLRVLGGNPVLAQIGARELAPITAAGVLGEPHTVTWRSPEVMLSTVVDHRPGAATEQAHAWQATIDADALVFTTHPTNAPGTRGRGEDSGYWTGSASMPRSAQVDRVSIHCYLPAYEPLDLSAVGFEVSYLPLTHAFFPRERFDEVVEVDGWVVGRRGDGYVALWSRRPTEWRRGPAVSSATFDEPFDLVADGDARNVWICEVGRAPEWPSFASFVDAVASAPVRASLGPAGWTVRYGSPTAGELHWGSTGPLAVDGTEVPLRGFPRHRSKWGEVCHRAPWLTLTDGDPAAGGARLSLDARTFAREVA
jgi:hypothetical protein